MFLYQYFKNKELIKIPAKYFLAIEAAIKASAVIMDFYQNGYKAEYKNDGSPVTEADIASSQVIVEILKETGFPVMDEESKKADYSVRSSWEYYWCVDPLDGTKEFIKQNGEFVVNIALIKNFETVFGIIASPVKKDLILGGKEYGGFYSTFEEALHPKKWMRLIPGSKPNKPLVMISSRSHFSGISLDFVNILKDHFGEVRYVRRGSAMKFFNLVFRQADVYPRFAPTMEWDIAAGQAILEGIGGEVVEYETGLPLTYNKKNLENPHFVAKTKPFIAKNIRLR